MNTKKILAVILVLMVSFAMVLPSFANGNEEGGSGIETFLSVLRAWGGFLAVITGSYDSLENIAAFSNFARVWNDFMESDSPDKEGFFKALLRWFGIAVSSNSKNDIPAESYSL